MRNVREIIYKGPLYLKESDLNDFKTVGSFSSMTLRCLYAIEMYLNIFKKSVCCFHVLLISTYSTTEKTVSCV